MPKSQPELIENMRRMAHAGHTASGVLRYLAIDEGFEQQLPLMELFRDAFHCQLGNVTAIGAWWHDDSCELDDGAIDAYINYVIEDFLASAAK